MTTIQGIKFENDASGKPISITVSLEKYGLQLEPFLRQIGILEQKDSFDVEWEDSITSEEFLEKSIHKIDSLNWKK